WRATSADCRIFMRIDITAVYRLGPVTARPRSSTRGCSIVGVSRKTTDHTNRNAINGRRDHGMGRAVRHSPYPRVAANLPGSPVYCFRIGYTTVRLCYFDRFPSGETMAANDSGTRPRVPHRLGDFTTQPRIILISALALPIGALAAVVAVVLLKLI